MNKVEILQEIKDDLWEQCKEAEEMRASCNNDHSSNHFWRYEGMLVGLHISIQRINHCIDRLVIPQKPQPKLRKWLK